MDNDHSLKVKIFLTNFQISYLKIFLSAIKNFKIEHKKARTHTKYEKKIDKIQIHNHYDVHEFLLNAQYKSRSWRGILHSVSVSVACYQFLESIY